MSVPLRLTTILLVICGALTTVGAAPQSFEQIWRSKSRQPVTGSTPGVTVAVVTFLDWQCPACRATERAYAPVFADVERRLPGVMSVETRDYPLNTACNPNVQISLHTAGCEAAVAVRLARQHGAAQALIDWLFAKQETLTPGLVREAAATVGRATDFSARYDAVLREVALDIADARRFGVTSTPSYFINGVLARGDNGRLYTADEMRQAIAIELQRKDRP